MANENSPSKQGPRSDGGDDQHGEEVNGHAKIANGHDALDLAETVSCLYQTDWWCRDKADIL